MDWRHSHEGSWTTYESAVKDVNVGISPVNELENSCKVLFEIMQMQQQGGTVREAPNAVVSTPDDTRKHAWSPEAREVADGGW